MRRQPSKFEISVNAIMGMIVLVAILVLLFYIARGIFQILMWAAPFLIIAALIINYRTVLGFGKMLVRLLTTRFLIGLVAVILTVIGFPVVCGFLFGKALIDRKIRKLREAEEPRDDFVDYEVIEEDHLDLRHPEKEEANKYEDLLDDDRPS